MYKQTILHTDEQNYVKNCEVTRGHTNKTFKNNLAHKLVSYGFNILQFHITT